MGLTETKIKSTTSGRLTDGHGLYLLVKSKGRGWWRLDYQFAGKRKGISMGTYPEVKLADARKRRDEARSLIASGVDPSRQRKAEKDARTGANSFETVARNWHKSQQVRWSEAHAGRILSRLEKDVFPVIGSKPIGEVAATDMIDVVRSHPV